MNFDYQLSCDIIVQDQARFRLERYSADNYTVSGKKSLRYFRFIFDKLKPLFIIFGRSRPEYSLYSTVEIFVFYIAMSLRRADVIMTSLKMPLAYHCIRVKNANNVSANNLTNLNFCL